MATGARRPALIKKQKKIIKKTRSEQYVINKKYLGDEPVFTDKEVTDSQHGSNLYWYNAMCSNSEAKDYLLEYLNNTNRIEEARAIQSVPDKWMPTTACWIARMRSRGARLPSQTLHFFETRLAETIDRDYSRANRVGGDDDGEDNEVKQVSRIKPTVQDRMKIIVGEYICSIEEVIDEFISNGYSTDFSMYNYLKASEVPPVQAKKIFDYLDPQLSEIEEAYNKTDKDIVEGYSGHKPQNLEKLYDFFLAMCDDIERYSQNEKKVRKPRTPKPVTAEKKLKDFKYQQADHGLKLQSIRPDTILGAKELWVFSTKYNQLTVFRSAAGLDVHRTAITQFDVSSSMTKKLRSKDVQTVLNEVLTGGKVTLRNLMSTIRGSDQRLQERMNENTILLRVVK